VRFAYADPPYPGQARDLYANHPDYAGEVDHAKLVERLCRDYPDGWCLSTSARALRMVLPLCPEDVWTAAWHKTNAPPTRTTGRRIWSWEPVIIWGGRQDPSHPRVRDALSCGQGYGFPGQKPPPFTRWIVELLGATHEDTIDDLFPGSGAVGAVLAEIRTQPALQIETLTLDGEPAPKRQRRYAGLPGSKSHRVI
jgi:hypothetical protein